MHSIGQTKNLYWADEHTRCYRTAAINNLRLLTPALHVRVMQVQVEQSYQYHNHLEVKVEAAVPSPSSHHIAALPSHLCDVCCAHRCHDDDLWTGNVTYLVTCAYDACADALDLCPCASSKNPSLLRR